MFFLQDHSERKMRMGVNQASSVLDAWRWLIRDLEWIRHDQTPQDVGLTPRPAGRCHDRAQGNASPVCVG